MDELVDLIERIDTVLKEVDERNGKDYGILDDFMGGWITKEEALRQLEELHGEDDSE